MSENVPVIAGAAPAVVGAGAEDLLLMVPSSLSILDSHETLVQFIKMIQTGFSELKTFSGKKIEYRTWYIALEDKARAVSMSGLLTEYCVPVCVVGSTVEAKQAFRTKVEKLQAANHLIRMKIKEVLPVDLRVAVDQQAPTKTEAFFSKVVLAEPLRSRVLTAMTQYTDEKGVQYIERQPAVCTIIAYLHKRFSAITELEKHQLYTELVMTKIGKGETFVQFITNVREKRNTALGAGVPVQDEAMKTLVLSQMPSSTEVLVHRMMQEKWEVDQIIDGLEMHFRDLTTMAEIKKGSNPGKNSNQSALGAGDPAVDALVVSANPTPVFDVQDGGSNRGRRGGRGRGGKWRGGRGRGGSNARGGRFEFRDGKPVCACCGGVGHKQAVCPSAQDSPAVSAPTVSGSTAQCSFCHKPGHTAERCFQKQREERKNTKVSMLAQTVPASQSVTSFVVSISVYSDTTSTTKNDFLVDSGSQRHICNNKNLFTELKEMDTPIRIGGVVPGQFVMCTHVGTIFLELEVDGQSRRTTISDVLYVVSCPCSLLSTAWLHEKGIGTETIPVKNGQPALMTGIRKDEKTGNFEKVFQARQSPNTARMLLSIWPGWRSSEFKAVLASNVVCAQRGAVSTCTNSNPTNDDGRRIVDEQLVTNVPALLSLSHIGDKKTETSASGEQSETWICNDPDVSLMMFSQSNEKSVCETSTVLCFTIF